MIKRKLHNSLLNFASKYPVVSIIGPRQSGKTTLVKNSFPEKNYVSLEEPDTREFAQTDPRGFLASYPEGAILDEIQRAPELFSYIQTIVDEMNQPGMFILTGSNNYLLQENISQTLAGRVVILTLLPLSMEELSPAGYEIDSLEDILFTGLYPRIFDQQIEPEIWYSNYIQTYIERDLRLIKNISDLSTFQRFIKLCAGRTGQILNLSSLGNDCGITHSTAKSWISILEASFVVFLLQPHYKNFSKRLIKQPKIYFFDPGLASSLLGIENKVQLNTHYLKGGLFETFILSELHKYRFNRGLKPLLYFWRDNHGKEIDCIIESGDKLTPLEIKAGKTINKDFFKGLLYWQKIAANDTGQGFIIYGGDNMQKREQGQVISWRHINTVYEQ